MQKNEIRAESWNWVQKLEIKLIDRKVAKEKLTDGQSNLLFSNQAHALDGAIHGAIFPWLRDTIDKLMIAWYLHKLRLYSFNGCLKMGIFIYYDFMSWRQETQIADQYEDSILLGHKKGVMYIHLRWSIQNRLKFLFPSFYLKSKWNSACNYPTWTLISYFSNVWFFPPPVFCPKQIQDGCKVNMHNTIRNCNFYVFGSLTLFLPRGSPLTSKIVWR